MRVLCIDIEGGYGGSSRSLYESVRHLHEDVDIEIWCRKAGPIQMFYKELGVPCRVMPDMPHISTLPRFSRNLYIFLKFAMTWRSSRAFREELSTACERFDIVHLNHDGLFLLARDLRSRIGKRQAITMHIRNFMPRTLFSRWQYRTAAHSVDSFAFITENEQQRATELAGEALTGKVIYNIVSPQMDDVSLRKKIADDKRFKVAVLSNFDLVRGTDRLIDVAIALAQKGRRDVLFVVAGNMSLTGALPGELGQVARAGGDLEVYAQTRGVADMFLFLGHISDPQSVLVSCDVLAKPTREYNPWGRDILEAMSFARPPITIGSYARFVEDGVTGVLNAEFDAEVWADEIIHLADNKVECTRLGNEAKKRVLKLCDGPSRAKDLSELWKSAAGI